MSSKTKKITLASPRFKVILGDVADDTTWTELEVQSMTRDMVSAEALFQKRKWGAPSDRAILYSSVIAYQALRRTAQIDQSTSWDQFEAGCVEVEGLDDDDEVGPTQSDPEAD